MADISARGRVELTIHKISDVLPSAIK
ncbi:hypothetical protein AGR4A_Cc180003 [Agrobacterium tumefaciens str. B6]|uniref:Uncharacterized protein n=1 Tax=Agrobacterium tumefaciens str. B6 TaxID=1183423 RepID=A0A822UYV8_AGRTU|nr:hypothetical protein AGR4A_Cc180003 [Agrobacterium tumefaciens str. B6]